MSISRRELLRRAGLFGVATVLSNVATACGGTDGEDAGDTGDGLPEYEYDGPEGPEGLFSHGVASGDPLTDSVILWTRVTPDDDGTQEVFLEVATDAEFTARVIAEYFETDAAADFTVKIDTEGLQPGTTYYYRFRSRDKTSPIGRTRTAPEGNVTHLRFAVTSCASLAHGYFHAYQHMAEMADLDLVLNLGDYIYEYATGEYGTVREYEPAHEIVTLEDYRQRYAQYRREPELQEAHRQHPFVTVWDDHESADNSWTGGAKNHQPETEGEWPARLTAAQQAYAEWMPIRTGDPAIIYRALAYGDLVDLIMLDTRLAGRDETFDNANNFEVTQDPDRTLLGFDQEAWFADQLSNSTATWRVVGQQVVMAQFKLVGAPNSEGGGSFLNGDQWDGYVANRDRIYQQLRDESIDNFVVLTGDIHSSFANDLTEDPNNEEWYDPATGDGAVGVEFVCPGITSPGAGAGFAGVITSNPHVQYLDLEQRGYMVLDITPEQIQTDWYYVADVEATSSPVTYGTSYAVEAGVAHTFETTGPATGKADPPPLAP